MDGLTQRKEECRDTRGVNGIENIRQYIRSLDVREVPRVHGGGQADAGAGDRCDPAVFSVVNAVLPETIAISRPRSHCACCSLLAGPRARASIQPPFPSSSFFANSGKQSNTSPLTIPGAWSTSREWSRRSTPVHTRFRRVLRVFGVSISM